MNTNENFRCECGLKVYTSSDIHVAYDILKGVLFMRGLC